MNPFQASLFAKIVPNCKKLGLLDAGDGWLRDRFTEIGVIDFEDAPDTEVEYELLDAVAADRAAGYGASAEAERRPAHRVRRAGRGSRPRGISTAPRVARCGVHHCTSRSTPPAAGSASTRASSATFDASRSRWNIDSPAKSPPIATP